MKHSPPPASSAGPRIALAGITLILFASACATIPSLPAKPLKYQLANINSAQDPVININSASAEELEKLPGIGKGIAERIIAHRESYGEFRRVEHLMMVRGISDRKFRTIRSMISVD